MAEDHRTFDGGWHLDKKVPISLILGFLAQIGLFIYSYSELSERVERLEEAIKTRASDDALRTSAADMERRIQLLRSEHQAHRNAPAHYEAEARLSKLTAYYEQIKDDVREIKATLRLLAGARFRDSRVDKLTPPSGGAGDD